MDSDIKNYLKFLRVSKGYSIHKMACILGKTDSEYKKLEDEGIQNITIGDCRLLIKELDINPLELIVLFS